VTRVPFTYTWIEQDKILAGSIPQLVQDLEILKSLGVSSILTLTRRDIGTYPDFHQWLNDNHWFWVQRPIPDGGLAGNSTMFSAVDYIDAMVGMNRTIYVHCRGGIGRTGTILLAYYVLQRGLSLADAKEIVKVRRNYEGNASAIDQGSPQREWIDALESNRDRYIRLGGMPRHAASSSLHWRHGTPPKSSVRPTYSLLYGSEFH
jgi:hypothetical protein